MASNSPSWTKDILGPIAITQDSVNSVTKAMNISTHDAERQRFLTDISSFDVSACPGSGKTTLVVAKIMLLSRSWESRSRGIAMLSHTNVAKNEVAKRFEALGEKISTDGRPHYIGTIHSFVNKFLTTPYLLSLGIDPKAIDDDVTLKARRHLLGGDFYGLNNFLQRKHTSLAAIRLTDADLDKPFGASLLNIASAGTSSYRSAANAVRESVRLGYLCHDEIFVFANRYLDLHPEVATALRYRFPFIMIDEMQDTTTEQARLLERIFPRNIDEISVERIGDPNQAIYGLDQQNDFPQADHLSIANSFRFDDTIARLASPLAVHPVQPSGLRGTDVATDRQHAFIVFHNDVIDMVLPTFAQLVVDTAPDHVIRTSKISAVGARHHLAADEADNPNHFPKVLKHYLSTYKSSPAETSRSSKTFVEYVCHARGLVEATGELSAGLEHVAAGLLAYVNRRKSYGERLSIKTRKYRQLMDLLETTGTDCYDFRSCLSGILSPSMQPTCSEVRDVGKLALTLMTPLITEEDSITDDLDFFETQVQPSETTLSVELTAPTNTYLHATDGTPPLLVELSSIHAAKGETHGATLVLDTFNRAHFVAKLLPWLTGKKSNASAKASDSDKKRLHECYVAMTRPTHLLAVAAAEKSLGKTEAEIIKSIQELEAHGWSVTRLAEQTSDALEPIL